MRRAWLMVAVASIMVVAGCGRVSYEKRLEKTLDRLKYEGRVKKNLEPVADDKKAKDLAIYVRAPKGMVLAKTGQLPVGEGQFDLDQSYLQDKVDAALHVVARVKMPKKAAAKGSPPPPPPPQRGEFTHDLLEVLKGIYGQDKLETPKFVEETTPRNHVKFKRLIFTALEKEVNVYTYKEGNHEVAIIFVYAPTLKNELATKIELCLDNFAAGTKAMNLYSGGAADQPEAPSQNGPL